MSSISHFTLMNKNNFVFSNFIILIHVCIKNMYNVYPNQHPKKSDVDTFVSIHLSLYKSISRHPIQFVSLLLPIHPGMYNAFILTTESMPLLIEVPPLVYYQPSSQRFYVDENYHSYGHSYEKLFMIVYQRYQAYVKLFNTENHLRFIR